MFVKNKPNWFVSIVLRVQQSTNVINKQIVALVECYFWYGEQLGTHELLDLCWSPFFPQSKAGAIAICFLKKIYVQFKAYRRTYDGKLFAFILFIKKYFCSLFSRWPLAAADMWFLLIAKKMSVKFPHIAS